MSAKAKKETHQLFENNIFYTFETKTKNS